MATSWRALELPSASVHLELTEAELGRELDALRRSGQTVGDLMISPVITTTEDAPIADAVRVMTKRGIKRLPVIDHFGHARGHGQSGGCAARSPSPWCARPANARLQPGVHVKVGDVMLTQVPTVAPMHR